jgi:hypothetical protein
MLIDGMNEDLEWLQNWYVAACDGDWEHDFGISINTLDNPGWTLKINIAGTQLADQIQGRTFIERTDTDWCFWEVKEQTFTAFGGPENLIELVRIFRSWAESAKT